MWDLKVEARTLRTSALALPLVLMAAVYVPSGDGGRAHATGEIPVDVQRAWKPFFAAGQTAIPASTITPEAIAAALARINPDQLDPGGAAAPFQGNGSVEDYGRALHCLTEAVYHEARSESLDGQRAVAQVVLNRVRHPAFPASVCGVVYQGSERSTGCQFSFTCDGSLRRQITRKSWEVAEMIARAALDGFVFTPVGMATHYHANYVTPWWASRLNHAVTIGTHIFYRWRGEWGDRLSFRQDYAGGERLGADGLPATDDDSGAGVAVQSRSIERGVAVFRGATAQGDVQVADADSGVRIHRGGATDDGEVRVHRGADAPEG